VCLPTYSTCVAPWYGAGLSELRLGEALKGKNVTISTKSGRIVKPKADLGPNDRVEEGYEGHFFTDDYHMNRPCWTYTGDGVRESVRQSCERLQVDRIVCLRLHDAEDEERYAEASAPGGAIETMIKLREEGIVQEISLGMNKHEYIFKFLKKYPRQFDNVMLAGCFNLIDHECVDLLMECQAQGVKITNVGIFASGVLWGGEHYQYGGVPDEVKAKIEAWTALAAKFELSLPQVAFNFAFLPEIVDYVAFGTGRVEAVDQNVELVGTKVDVALWQQAKQAGLIHPSIPVPTD